MREISKVLVHTGDGSAGSGKGTIGSWHSEHSVPHLDTGQGYRAVTEHWLRTQEEADRQFDRTDTERVREVARRFTSDENKLALFTDMLNRRVAFGVEGVRIDQDRITPEEVPTVLYQDAINNVISFLARKESVRRFCGSISIKFVLDAAHKEKEAVYLDGRNERNVIVKGLKNNEQLRRMAHLGLAAFFRVDTIEAAHRTLSRDQGITYRSLADGNPAVLARAKSLEERNYRDSDSTQHADPMRLTSLHLVAWKDVPSPEAVDEAIGVEPDGSDSRHVLFDTTGRTKEETQEEYEWWLDGVIQHFKKR